jgi:hypothetical protein
MAIVSIRQVERVRFVPGIRFPAQVADCILDAIRKFVTDERRCTRERIQSTATSILSVPEREVVR